jgi:hypothetical protein
MRALPIVFLLLTAAALPAQADALEDFDATILRGFIILKCHGDQDKADQEVMARVDAVKKAALEQLWAQFDKANPSRHEANGKTAQATLDRRSEAHDLFIQSQVTEYGCDWLDGKAFQTGRN